MRVEITAPVVIVPLPGGLGGDLYHLPAAERSTGVYRRLADYPSPPETWPTVCGLDGDVYVYNGPIRRRRMCAVCRAAAPAALLAADGGYIAWTATLAAAASRKQLTRTRLTPAHLEVLYRAKYVGEGLGVDRIGELVYQRFGFPSARHAGAAIYRGFKLMGFELRSQSEATALRNYRHGRRRRVLGESGPAVQEYRAWLREERGDHRPVCKAVKAQSPGKGQPCSRPAMRGSDFCDAHDPGRRDERSLILARMRARQPVRDLVSWPDVRGLLEPWLARQAHPATALREATGVAHAHTLLHDRFPTVTVKTAERLLAPFGFSLDDLYRQAAA